MVYTQENAAKAIYKDMEDLKLKVDRIESMFETLIEIYSDVLYDVRDEYVKKLEKIRKEGDFEEFSDVDELRKLIEGEED